MRNESSHGREPETARGLHQWPPTRHDVPSPVQVPRRGLGQSPVVLRAITLEGVGRKNVPLASRFFWLACNQIEVRQIKRRKTNLISYNILELYLLWLVSEFSSGWKPQCKPMGTMLCSSVYYVEVPLSRQRNARSLSCSSNSPAAGNHPAPPARLSAYASYCLWVLLEFGVAFLHLPN